MIVCVSELSFFIFEIVNKYVRLLKYIDLIISRLKQSVYQHCPNYKRLILYKKTQLIILSDLYGRSKINWEQAYINHFQDKYNVQYYDCCDLGEVDKTDYSQENLHQQFVRFGIEKAIQNLLKLEKKEVTILAFSIGGTIAWKAALNGLKVQKLIALSATRLRYETEKPNCDIDLYYGENDRFQPKKDWFNMMNIEPIFLENKEHDFYRMKGFQNLSGLDDC